MGKKLGERIAHRRRIRSGEDLRSCSSLQHILATPGEELRNARLQGFWRVVSKMNKHMLASERFVVEQLKSSLDEWLNELKLVDASRRESGLLWWGGVGLSWAAAYTILSSLYGW